jgi:fumarate reductase flavoprotein subunit
MSGQKSFNGTDLRFAENDSFDVIVVGGGGSGLAAAAAAGQAGARVLVLEKQAQLGGTTWLAVGSISAAGTRLQKRAGIFDDPKSFVEDMEAFTADLLPRDNPGLRAMLAREAGPTVDWLEDLGVAFAGPYAEPPHRVLRMHNTVPGPRLIIDRLERAAHLSGAVIHTGATSQELLQDSNGRVYGVTYRVEGQDRRATARGGVILASGDFSGNETMRQAYLASAAARAVPLNPHNQGDGFALVQPLNAALCNMDAIFGPQLRFPRASRLGLNERMPSWPWLARAAAIFFMHAPKWMLKPLVRSLMIANMSPSESLFKAGAVLVSSTGHILDSARPAQSVAHTVDRTGYIVMTAQVAKAFSALPNYISTAPGIAYAFFQDYARGRPDLVHSAENSNSLAISLGMDALSLASAIGDLAKKPLVALGPVQAMLTTTEGALSVDDKCQVLDANGSVLAGLYAAGCMAQGGMLLRGHGLHLAWAFTSGRITGNLAAQASRSEAQASHIG